MPLPAWLVWYRRPEYQDIKSYASSIRSGHGSVDSRTSTASTRIPQNMQFERVLKNETSSPVSLYDFYMYLKYIEFSPENLEFYVWYFNYKANYRRTEPKEHKKMSSSGSKTAEKEIHGPVDPQLCIDTMDHIYALLGAKKSHAAELQEIQAALGSFGHESAMEQGTAPASRSNNSSHTDTESLSSGRFSSTTSVGSSSRGSSTLHTTLPVDPRTEIAAITKLFLQPGADKELNLPAPLRAQALIQLQASADPEVLTPVAEHVRQALHNCSHRNFVRLAMSNGTTETICASTVMGIIFILKGFAFLAMRAIGGKSRFEVFCAWPFWWLGMGLVLSGLRGCCFFLLLPTVRQRLPWERYDDGMTVAEAMAARAQHAQAPKPNVLKRMCQWLGRTMLFDRKMRVRTGELRQLQRLICFQAAMGGIVFANACVLAFIFLPFWQK